MILEKTLELIKQIYKYHKIVAPKITNVVIGLGYTGVEVSAYCYEPILGLAQTLPNIIRNFDCSKIDYAGNLMKLPLTEILSWVTEKPSLQKIIGIATLNAVSQHILEIENPYKELQDDLLEFLKINQNSRILFIGNIRPLIKKVYRLTKYITIVDNNPYLEFSNNFSVKQSVDELSDEEVKADIVFCSGSSLITDSLEDILSLFRKDTYIIVLGPTVSFIPEILFDYGVDIVGGIKIIDSKCTIQVLKEAGGTKIFKEYGKKYNFIRN
ncbi:MAG: Rossmann-like domain-containing protein [Candidatus Heimdallarchaeota archaeon]